MYLLQMYFLWMYLHVIVFTLQTNNLHWSVYMQLYLQRLQIYISNTFCKCIYMWPNENAHFQKSNIIFNDTLWTRKLGWKRINRKTLWLGGWEKTNRGANRSASIYAMRVQYNHGTVEAVSGQKQTNDPRQPLIVWKGGVMALSSILHKCKLHFFADWNWCVF